LTKKINDSEFLLPQMHPEQLREAIASPVEVMSAKMTEKLIGEILNDMKTRPEQLPLMQHALMRTWEFWQKTSSSHDVIDVHHYHAIGGIKRSLSMHADEIYAELSDNQRNICEKLFKSITRKSEEGKGVNQPTKLSELADIAAVNIDEVSIIVEAFRKQGRSILLPSFFEPLQANSLVELSNPEITTLWGRLDQWALEETESVKDYVRLAESAVRHQQGKGDRLRNPELQLSLNWYKKEKPTLTWGVRHHPSYELAIQYLEFSDKEDKNEIIRRRKVQRRNMLISRIIAIIFILLGIGGGMLGAYAWIQKKHADKEAIKANEESEKAKLSAEAAEKSAKEAEKSAKEAEEEKVKALEAKSKADSALKIADFAKNQAIIAKNDADAAMVKAVAEKKKADIATQQALLSQEETQRIRNLSMASAMAVKAPKVTDPKIMAKMARQAFIIHKNYKGDEFSADQYSGLYHAIKAIEDENFNVLKGHRDGIRDLIFIAGENNIRLFTASSDRQSLSTYIPAKSKDLSSIHTSDYIYRCMSLHPNGKGLIAGTHEGLVLFYQSPTSAESSEASPFPGEIIEIESFDNQKFITLQAGLENPLLLWNGQKVELNIKPFKKGKLHDFSISNKNKWLGCATDGGDVFYLDYKKQWEKVKIDSMTNKFWVSTFSPNEKFFLAGDNEGNMFYWNIENPEKPIRVELPKQHTARITEMKFSSDGKWFASASLDGTVRLWNWTNLRNSPIVLDDYGYWVTSIGFSPDNQWLVTGCSNGIVKWFPTDVNFLFNRLNEKASEIMTLEEWQSQVSETVPYDKTFKELQKGK
jgi:WD40 repeat protein